MYQPKKTLIALTDADGCIYNPLYNALVMHLIARYSKIFDEYAHNKEVYNQKKEEADVKLNEILDMLEKNDGKEIESQLEVYTSYNQLVDAMLESQGELGFFDNDDDLHYTVLNIKNRYIKCIKNCGELGQKIHNALVCKANKPYFDELKLRAESENFNNLILMCGSNRQSKCLDKYNSKFNGTSSFFLVLKALTNKLNEMLLSGESGVNCILDTFLMADLYGNQKPGVSFDMITNNNLEDLFQFFKHADAVFDKRKFSLLYSTMHYLSLQRPYEKITLTFWDDRHDILCPLLQVFANYPRWIPKNIRLQSYPYNGEFIVSRMHETRDPRKMMSGYMFSVQGEGVTDPFYETNMCKLAAKAGYNQFNRNEIDLLKTMNYKEFKNERLLPFTKQNENRLQMGM